MANAYVAAPALGVLVAVAIALHNLPEEFAMAVPVMLLRSKRLLFGAAFLSALAEPLGAILGLVAVSIAPSLMLISWRLPPEQCCSFRFMSSFRWRDATIISACSWAAPF